jgi:Reverse transcriptase (RNA-dependent DNA polymerase)
VGRKFTTLPREWRELYPDLQQWFGVPLRLKKLLYGDITANLAWDETQNQWLTSPEIGFSRLDSKGSIYIRRNEHGMIAILNAVDDQLYFATTPELKQWFESATQARFDVTLMGQATCYLQSRITQETGYSIVVDQTRYAALIVAKYMPASSVDNITEEEKRKFGRYDKGRLQHEPQ